jgi:hypothetical protein
MRVWKGGLTRNQRMDTLRTRILRVAAAAVALHAAPMGVAAQHVHPGEGVPPAAAQPKLQLRGGAHAVPLLTHVSPILQGASMTEAYLTQPTLLGEVATAGGALRLRTSISLEALTIDRGELGAGAYGEGYIDRRHPHTYLHELMLTVERDVGAARTSAAVGRGFVPFGTDDPMMRPFVKFPVNHHLGQILERLLVAGGVRAGPFMVEAAVFGGNEPMNARDMGRLDRFGDSWAARFTAEPVPGLELQASRAHVISPEMPTGDGGDQRKWSAAARYSATQKSGGLYTLIEWKRTTEIERGRDLYSYGSALLEAAVDLGGWRPAVRIERSERPEEERTFDPFRTVWPHGGSHGMGLTRWTIVGARVEKALAVRGMSAAPFVEASAANVQETGGGLFEPDLFYGSTRIWTVNLGARLGVGWHPARMGRYGVAAAGAAHRHDVRHH